MSNTSVNCIENIWLEVDNNNGHHIFGGTYRHPNQQIDDFMGCLDCVLNKIANQNYPRFIAGDINIDVTKCNLNKQTAEYVDMLLSNNFVPTIILPTRITSYSATLVEHMHY